MQDSPYCYIISVLFILQNSEICNIVTYAKHRSYIGLLTVYKSWFSLVLFIQPSKSLYKKKKRIACNRCEHEVMQT